MQTEEAITEATQTDTPSTPEPQPVTIRKTRKKSVRGTSTGAGTDKEPLTGPIIDTPSKLSATATTLSKKEKETLALLEKDINDSRQGMNAAFHAIVTAFHQIRKEKLYRETHSSFEVYFSEKWGYGRSHSNRLADAGEIVARQELSPAGDTIKLLTSESHYRPLATLEAEKQDAVIELTGAWAHLSGDTEATPRLVESAKLVLNPPQPPTPPEPDPLIVEFQTIIDDTKKQVPKSADKETRKLFDQMKKKVAALGNPTRTSGIDWTDSTWNPLQGCSRVSAGCDNCYAAKLVATRLSAVYPGLATEVEKDKKKTYIFNNVIKLLPEQLGDPLRDRTPRRYFVNSMSDLFHDKVPDEFIAAVFDVMEKATWHQFQVLTKRPKRMAEFTTARYKDRTPPANVWLGTSTENQKALDERLPHLLDVKAAIRWLSCEPLLGPIKLDNLDGIDWVVVGGESGSKRAMEIAWATTIRDACKDAGVPFFFKQYSDYGEDGKKLKKDKKDGLTPPPLEGVIHNAYPAPRAAETTKTEEPKTEAAPATTPEPNTSATSEVAVVEPS